MPRVLVAPQDVHANAVTLTDPETVHHLRRVLRVKPGDWVDCYDGRGRSYGGRLAVKGGQWLVEIERQTRETPPATKLVLAQALIEPNRFEWVLQKATELGATEIVPMTTERSTVRDPDAVGRQRQSRWKRIIESAATQCGRASLPRLSAPQPFSLIVQSDDPISSRVLLTPQGNGMPLRDAISQLRQADMVMVMIGPEGDFSPQEITLAAERHIMLATLGRLILRSETAALAALAIVQHGLER